MTKIKLFATDVDGTMTDGCMYYAENGIICDIILLEKLRYRT